MNKNHDHAAIERDFDMSTMKLKAAVVIVAAAFATIAVLWLVTRA